MFNVMIVDDEPVNRHGLVNFIEWVSMDCKISGEAEDGIEAMEKIELHQPDIVIADIKMPGMDGIQLSKHIYENYPLIKVILLTGYSEFHYAQSAIKYGVVDFILKPSSTEKIIEAVTKAKNLIIESREKDEKLNTLESKIAENTDLMREKFILDYINGVIFEQDLLVKEMKQLNINIDSFYCLVFEFDSLRYASTGKLGTKKVNSIYEMKNFLSMVFKDNNQYIVSISGNILCSVISFSNDEAACSSVYIQSRCEEILEIMKTFTSISMFIGISDLHHDSLELPAAFKEANSSLSYKFYNDKKIYKYSDYNMNEALPEEINISVYMDRIMSNIKNSNADDAVNVMFELMEKEKTTQQSIEHIRSSGVMLCSLCSGFLGSYSITLREILNEYENINSEILACETYEKLTELLELVIRRVCEFAASMNIKSNYIVKSTMDYISDNFRKPIKLKDIADYIHVNSSYLSRLIRKETGETITDIIAKFRVEKAKELLRSKNIKAYQVAEMVGIEDTAYFSYIFKRYTGQSPSEFKYSGK